MITIIARKWLNWRVGNTYHSCEVYNGHCLVGRVPFTYGYGECWKVTALNILNANGYRNNDYYGFLRDIRDHPKEYLLIVTDVGRKRDL